MFCFLHGKFYRAIRIDLCSVVSVGCEFIRHVGHSLDPFLRCTRRTVKGSLVTIFVPTHPTVPESALAAFAKRIRARFFAALTLWQLCYHFVPRKVVLFGFAIFGVHVVPYFCSCIIIFGRRISVFCESDLGEFLWRRIFGSVRSVFWEREKCIFCRCKKKDAVCVLQDRSDGRH